MTTRTYLAACHRILTNENEYKMCNCIDIGQISKRSRVGRQKKKKTAEAKRKCEELKNNFRIRASRAAGLLIQFATADDDGRRGIRISKEKKCITQKLNSALFHICNDVVAKRVLSIGGFGFYWIKNPGRVNVRVKKDVNQNFISSQGYISTIWNKKFYLQNRIHKLK